jgi:hypothetical protein
MAGSERTLAIFVVAVHLCFAVSSSSLRGNTDPKYGRTAYHFQPATNWMNGNKESSFLVLLLARFRWRSEIADAFCFSVCSIDGLATPAVLLMIRGRSEWYFHGIPSFLLDLYSF